MFLIAISWLADGIWLLYWVPYWHSEQLAKWNAGLHNFVILCAFGGFVLKLIILASLATVKQADLRNSATSFGLLK